MTPQPDVYFKKVIRYRYCKKELQFRVSQDLFSSFQIDLGTQFLIRTLTPDCSSRFQRILDLGCGYGPVGLTLKALNPDCAVQMVDSDALAVEYSRQNAELNCFPGVEVYGSLDYDDVTARDFDLIVSNIPAKAGEPVIAHMLEDACHYLAPGGSVAVVVVNPLAATVANILGKNRGIEITEAKSRPGHTVYRYHCPKRHDETNPGRRHDPYLRGRVTFDAAGIEYALDTAYGLPEFEEVSYATGLLLDGLKNIQGKNVDHALIFNPGVGHVPVAVWRMLKPHRITLIDRDLLSLRYSARNLTLHGCPASLLTVEHQVGIGDRKENGYDLAAGVLREEEGTEATWQTLTALANAMSPHGMLLLGGSSTAITRLVARLTAIPTVKMKERARYRGFSLLVLETPKSR